MDHKRYDDIELHSFSDREARDVYSHTPEDVYSNSGRKKKKKRAKHRFLKLLAFLLCLCLIAGGGFYAYGYHLIDGVSRVPLDSADLGISSARYGEVKNIVLLGIDSQEDSNVGRSDAILVVTLDRKNGRIKMTSIARDSYVSIDGHGMDKLTHAYAYGRAQLAVKTLNQNYGLEITDYATVNFFGLSRIIDAIGGVTVDVSEEERLEMNNNIIPWFSYLGGNCEPVTSAGVQRLSGGQAVCYARIRHTDSDIERGNRQKEVLSAMFEEIKTVSPLKLPRLAEMMIGECETSLSTNDIITMGLWGILFSPEIEQHSVPNENIPSSGGIRGGVWYYLYDLPTASADIYDFIMDRGVYSEAEN